MIDFAADMFDYVVLDTPGTLDETVAVAIERATRIVTVTSLDLTSIKNTNLLLGYLESQGIDSGRALVTVSHNLEHNLATMDDVAYALERRVDYEVPFDPDIPRSAQLGKPVTVHRPHSDAAAAYAGLASLLAGERITMPAAPLRGGVLGRLLGRRPARASVPAGSPALTGAPGQ
ncbi:MAG: hypothetical protein U5Q44_06690 [Dehalococcoidia bacterium]|nr:hypothetical protein [Dehalococcoidia bacterium]